MKTRPYILTLAGFDPSAGAGVLADVKTFEANKCVGMAVQTANTIQTEDYFTSVNWLSEADILMQLSVLMDRYSFAGVKIGLIPSFSFLTKAIDLIRSKNESAIIIWDPVLSASAGFDFEHDLEASEGLLKQVNYITPNWNEVKQLSGLPDALQGAILLSKSTAVYLKGGHHPNYPGKDFLVRNGEIKAFNPKQGDFSQKHGSGCILASALTANLVLGYPEQKAILRTKRYMEEFLKSSLSLLGHHKL